MSQLKLKNLLLISWLSIIFFIINIGLSLASDNKNESGNRFHKTWQCSPAKLPKTVHEMKNNFEILNYRDSNTNGIYELYELDLDEDLICDVFLYDFNEDGIFDLVDYKGGKSYFIVKGDWIELNINKPNVKSRGFSKYFKIRLISSGAIGVGASFEVATFELQDVSTGDKCFITFTGIGIGIGFKGGTSTISPWCSFTSLDVMSLKDFESFGRLTNASISGGVGGGYTALSFYPTDKKHVYIEFKGINFGVEAGISTLGGWWEIRDS